MTQDVACGVIGETRPSRCPRHSVPAVKQARASKNFNFAHRPRAVHHPVEKGGLRGWGGERWTLNDDRQTLGSLGRTRFKSV